MGPAWYWKIAEETIFSSLTPILFALAVFGGAIAPRGKDKRLFHWWLAAMVLFVFVVGWGNRHQWYQLPLIPIAAVFAGCACEFIATWLRSRRILRALTFVFLATWFALASYYCAKPFYRSSAESLRRLGLVLNEATTPTALIIAATDGDPTVFYYASQRLAFPRGRIYQGNPIDSAQIIENLEKLRGRGATHIVFYAGTQWWLDYYREFGERLTATATLVEATPEFTIFRLAPPSP